MTRFLVSFVVSATMLLPNTGKASLEVWGSGQEKGFAVSRGTLEYILPSAVIAASFQEDGALREAFASDPLVVSYILVRESLPALDFYNATVEAPAEILKSLGLPSPYWGGKYDVCDSRLPPLLPERRPESLPWSSQWPWPWPPPPPAMPEREDGEGLSDNLHPEILSGPTFWLIEHFAEMDWDKLDPSAYESLEYWLGNAVTAKRDEETIFMLSYDELRFFRRLILIGDIATSGTLRELAAEGRISPDTLYRRYGFSAQEAWALDQALLASIAGELWKKHQIENTDLIGADPVKIEERKVCCEKGESCCQAPVEGSSIVPAWFLNDELRVNIREFLLSPAFQTRGSAVVGFLGDRAKDHTTHQLASWGTSYMKFKWGCRQDQYAAGLWLISKSTSNPAPSGAVANTLFYNTRAFKIDGIGSVALRELTAVGLGGAHWLVKNTTAIYHENNKLQLNVPASATWVITPTVECTGNVTIDYEVGSDWVVTERPSKPTISNFSFTAVAGTSVTAKWYTSHTSDCYFTLYDNSGYVRGQASSISKTTHTATVNGLNYETEYNYTIDCIRRDPDEDSEAAHLEGDVTTAARPEPPEISGIDFDENRLSVVAKWTTNRSSDCTLKLGSGSGVKTATSKSSKSHQVSIDGLNYLTTYPYEIRCHTVDGSFDSTKTGTVTTLERPAPPIISSVSFIPMDTSMKATWKTNVVSDCRYELTRSGSPAGSPIWLESKNTTSHQGTLYGLFYNADIDIVYIARIMCTRTIGDGVSNEVNAGGEVVTNPRPEPPAIDGPYESYACVGPDCSDGEYTVLSWYTDVVSDCYVHAYQRGCSGRITELPISTYLYVFMGTEAGVTVHQASILHSPHLNEYEIVCYARKYLRRSLPVIWSDWIPGSEPSRTGKFCPQ